MPSTPPPPPPNDSKPAWPGGAKERGAGRLVVLSRGAITDCILGCRVRVSGSIAVIERTPPSYRGHNRPGSSLAPPPPPAAHQPHPFLTGQAAELAPQVLQRIRTHRLTLTAQHRKTHRTIEGREGARLEPARLPPLGPVPGYTGPLLPLVIHR